jgi:hypothetical protein
VRLLGHENPFDEAPDEQFLWKENVCTYIYVYMYECLYIYIYIWIYVCMYIDIYYRSKVCCHLEMSLFLKENDFFCPFKIISNWSEIQCRH